MRVGIWHYVSDNEINSAGYRPPVNGFRTPYPPRRTDPDWEVKTDLELKSRASSATAAPAATRIIRTKPPRTDFMGCLRLVRHMANGYDLAGGAVVGCVISSSTHTL